MKCPRCNKNLMTEEEKERWGFCSDCFNEEWSKKLDERLVENIDKRLEQARNLLENYCRLEAEYGGYEDAVEHYRKYVDKLEKIKEKKDYERSHKTI